MMKIIDLLLINDTQNVRFTTFSSNKLRLFVYLILLQQSRSQMEMLFITNIICCLMSPYSGLQCEQVYNNYHRSIIDKDALGIDSIY